MTQQADQTTTSLPSPVANGTAANSQEETQTNHTNITPGVYEMTAIDAELGFTTGSDTEPPKPQVAVLLEFVDGPWKGLSLTWYGFFTEKTKAGTIRALRTLGWQGDDLTDLSGVRGSAPCTVQVEPDLNNVKRARVRFVGGGAIAMKNVMNVDQKKAFAESMKAFAATVAKPESKEEKKAAEAPSQGAPTGKPGQKFF